MEFGHSSISIQSRRPNLRWFLDKRRSSGVRAFRLRSTRYIISKATNEYEWLRLQVLSDMTHLKIATLRAYAGVKY
jgi:hypothetical protein